MKICMLTNTYVPHVGGVAKSVRTFDEHYRALGHEVLVVAPTFEDAEQSDETTVRVPAIQNFNGSDFSVRLPIPGYLDRRLRKFDADIYHSHHPFLLGDSALRHAREWSKPLVFTHHTLYERYTHYVLRDAETLQNLAIELATHYANLCDHVIAPSLSVARLLERRGVRSPITEVPTGVDVDFFRGGDGRAFREEHGLPPDAPVAGHLGRLAYEKNLGYLAEAFVTLLRGNEDAHVLIVGDGDARKDVERTLRDAGLAGRAHFPGKLTGQGLANAYAAMDVFAFASTSETQGMVLVEAMAAGKPVVALDASGTREVVEDGANGRLLETGTPADDFAAALDSLLRDSSQLETLSTGASRTAPHFSAETCAKRALAVYEDVLSRAGAGERTEDNWEALLARLDTEWKLVTHKASSLFSAVAKRKETRPGLQ